MSPIIAILLTAAAKVGAPVVKGLLEQHIGGAAGEIGGAVIDAVANKVGVPPEALPSVPAEQVEDAVRQVEAASPELIAAILEAQRETNKLMLAEMQKDSAFGWMWRPAGMWLMLVCIAWYIILRPIVNAVIWTWAPGLQIEMGLDVATFLGIFTIYTSFYMGGNTILRGLKK